MVFGLLGGHKLGLSTTTEVVLGKRHQGKLLMAASAEWRFSVSGKAEKTGVSTAPVNSMPEVWGFLFW